MADVSKIGAKSKATTANPKDLFGNKKVSLSKVPAIAVAHCAMAMMDGAEKYGPYNWRDKPVIASIYIDAAMRHLQLWFEGQRDASDSGAHHLGHAMACCAILLDAEHLDALKDDRPKTADKDTDWYEQAFNSFAKAIEARRNRAALTADLKAEWEGLKTGPTIDAAAGVDRNTAWWRNPHDNSKPPLAQYVGCNVPAGGVLEVDCTGGFEKHGFRLGETVNLHVSPVGRTPGYVWGFAVDGRVIVKWSNCGRLPHAAHRYPPNELRHGT